MISEPKKDWNFALQWQLSNNGLQVQSDWGKGKDKIKNFQSSSAFVVITFNSENWIKGISYKSWPNLYGVYVSQKYAQACVHTMGRKERTVSVVNIILTAEYENQVCLIPQKDYLRRNPSGFIFNQITIAKSFLNCIIPNHTIIRAEIQASVWYNCSFWLLLMILKVSTKDALVLSEIL